ncbi:uncharacterized protein LOC109842288 [Asparagus officinalis]|uniref:uncharacterized protein LOC109842288 n=1 Tax=Asparagus officinalis TaxID=4686 RepID=UPI00098E0435|nr:uncharacterized protein LOC109842288 [Asparagus officinalis]
MGSLVNEAQSAFVQGRQITSNTMLAELVKSYSMKHISPRAMINIDIRKAFDSISWSFIQSVLTGLGFPKVMINWIMVCITTPKYSISFNGGLHGYFKGEHDLLLFAKGETYSVQKLYQTFKSFGEVSGLEANPDKCSIFYGGVEDSVKAEIANILGFAEGSIPIKYLGVPLITKRLSYSDCFPLFDKITRKLQRWTKHRKLTYAGSFQIIKSVIFGVLIYWTSNYILPVKVLRRIDEICRHFLWGKDEHTSRMSLVAWEKACLGMKQSGMGIFLAQIWNTASALRSIWSIHSNKESLWIKWIHENYLKHGDVWQIEARSGDSWMWKQLLRIRNKVMAESGGAKNVKSLIMSSCKNSSKPKLSTLYKKLSPVTNSVPWHKTVWGVVSMCPNMLSSAG